MIYLYVSTTLQLYFIYLINHVMYYFIYTVHVLWYSEIVCFVVFWNSKHCLWNICFIPRRVPGQLCKVCRQMSGLGRLVLHLNLTERFLFRGWSWRPYILVMTPVHPCRECRKIVLICKTLMYNTTSLPWLKWYYHIIRVTK